MIILTMNPNPKHETDPMRSLCSRSEELKKQIHGSEVGGLPSVSNLLPPLRYPQAAVGWEACLYTPGFMASFVRDHLGPTLEKDHPGVKIIG